MQSRHWPKRDQLMRFTFVSAGEWYICYLLPWPALVSPSSSCTLDANSVICRQILRMTGLSLRPPNFRWFPKYSWTGSWQKHSVKTYSIPSSSRNLQLSGIPHVCAISDEIASSVLSTLLPLPQIFQKLCQPLEPTIKIKVILIISIQNNEN